MASESQSLRHRQFANFLAVASSVLGGAILQVFLSPPDAVVADPADPAGAASGWCSQLRSCGAWQRSWQLSCVVAFCFVILSIIACATSSIAKRASIALAAAVLFFFASFLATAVAVLSIVLLAFPKATCISTAALLVCLLISGAWFGWDGLVVGLDDVVLGPSLWRAASNGDVAAVRRCLRLGANMTWGGSVAESSVPKNSFDGGRRPYFLSSSGPVCEVTPLHIAASCGHVEVAAELLRHPEVKASAADSLGSTALHLAADNLDLEMVDLLLRHGADCWATNAQGWTPLLAAVETHVPGGPEPIVTRTIADHWRQFVAEVQIDTSEDPFYQSRKRVVKRLLRSRSKAINAVSPVNKLTALQLAIKRKWTSIAHRLINEGASADVAGTRQSTLGLACITPDKYDHLVGGGDMVERLLIAGANVDWQDEDGQSALHICMEYIWAAAAAGAPRSDFERIISSAMVLLDGRADVGLQDKHTQTAIMTAVIMPQPLSAQMTTMLLYFATPAAVSAMTDGHETALDFAVNRGNAEAVALLLAAGANPAPPYPTALTIKYETPLQKAVDKGCLEIARLLIDHGVDVNFFPPVTEQEQNLHDASARLGVTFDDFDSFGYMHMSIRTPPLLLAVAKKDAAMVELLLERGADVHETEKSSHAVVRLLMKAGMSADQTDGDGLRPADYARRAGNQHALRALQAPVDDDSEDDGSWTTVTGSELQEQSSDDEESDGVSTPPSPPVARARQLSRRANRVATDTSSRRHHTITINADPAQQQPQQRQAQRPTPRLSLLTRLVQATTRLMAPFHSISGGSPVRLLTHQSTTDLMPRTPRAYSTSSSSDSSLDGSVSSKASSSASE